MVVLLSSRTQPTMIPARLRGVGVMLMWCHQRLRGRMEILPGIHRIESDLGERFMCQYLLVGGESTVLVDTGLAGTPGEVIVPYLEGIGLGVEDLDEPGFWIAHSSSHGSVGGSEGRARKRRHGPVGADPGRGRGARTLPGLLRRDRGRRKVTHGPPGSERDRLGRFSKWMSCP